MKLFENAKAGDKVIFHSSYGMQVKVISEVTKAGNVKINGTIFNGTDGYEKGAGRRFDKIAPFDQKIIDAYELNKKREELAVSIAVRLRPIQSDMSRGHGSFELLNALDKLLKDNQY